MEEYFLALRDGPDKVCFRGFQGEPITIDGFEDFNLFLHRAMELWLVEKDQWVISEATTGVAVSGWAPSPEEAKAMAKEKLNKVGPDGFKEKIEAQIKKFGRSPWVEK